MTRDASQTCTTHRVDLSLCEDVGSARKQRKRVEKGYFQNFVNNDIQHCCETSSGSPAKKNNFYRWTPFLRNHNCQKKIKKMLEKLNFLFFEFRCSRGMTTNSGGSQKNMAALKCCTCRQITYGALTSCCTISKWNWKYILKFQHHNPTVESLKFGFSHPESVTPKTMFFEIWLVRFRIVKSRVARYRPCGDVLRNLIGLFLILRSRAESYWLIFFDREITCGRGQTNGISTTTQNFQNEVPPLLPGAHSNELIYRMRLRDQLRRG